jgi:hypothetical protein
VWGFNRVSRVLDEFGDALSISATQLLSSMSALRVFMGLGKRRFIVPRGASKYLFCFEKKLKQSIDLAKPST